MVLERGIWSLSEHFLKITDFGDLVKILFLALGLISCLGRLIVDVSRSHTIRHTHTHTHTHTHKTCKTALNKWSARRRHHYLHNIQQNQENFHVISGIPTHDPNNRAAVGVLLGQHGHRKKIWRPLFWWRGNNAWDKPACFLINVKKCPDDGGSTCLWNIVNLISCTVSLAREQ